MANRDLTNFRSVINQVVEQPSQTLELAAKFGEGILRQGEEAKLAEAASEVQLGLAELENQYRVDFESDPMGGMMKYKEQRQKLFDQYGKQTSPLYRNQWQTVTRNMAQRNDATQQTWALKQTRQNTVNSINRSIKNGLNQAYTDGKAFGLDDTMEIEAFVNYANSVENLEGYASSNLGEETAKNLFDSYDEDRLKQTLSGVAETNPAKALKLLETDAVKNSFDDPKQYDRMKEAISDRAFNFQQINVEREALNVITKTDEIYGLVSSGEVVGYAELQNELIKSGASKPAQDYILKRAGFAKADGGAKLSDDEKLEIESDLYDEIATFAALYDPAPEQIAEMQNKVYSALKSKAITRAKGESYLGAIVAPAVAKKAEKLSQFDIGEKSRIGTEFTLFGKDKGLGFSGLDEVIETISLPIDLTQTGTERVSTKNQKAKAFNNRKKLELYDLYYEELSKAAQERGLAVANIPDQPRSEQRKIYNKAQNEAKYNFWLNQYPEMSNIPKEEFPSTVITSGGEKIKTGFISKGSPVSAPTITEQDIDNMSIEQLKAFLGE